MKRKYSFRAISLVLAILLTFSLITVDAYAAVETDCEPNAKIEYGYSEEVSVGTVRYIQQNSGSYHYYSYWGGWDGQSSSECGTASISMALSYVGINKTPKAILDAHGGSTYFSGWGETQFLRPTVSQGMDNYINGNGKYSPVIIHLPGYSSRGHFLILIGRVSGNVYRALDPWNGNSSGTTWNITINGSQASYFKGSGSIDRVYQYYNENAEIQPEINENVVNYVTRLYQLVLEREPDEEGLNNWVNALCAKKITGAEAAKEFVFSKEYQNKNTDNESFVEMLYRTMLDRKADSAGKTDWVSQLESGRSRLSILAGFAGSQEFTEICERFGIIRGEIDGVPAVDKNPKAAEFVSRMYTEVLGRKAEAEGLEYWTAKLVDQEIGGGELSDGFFHSSEFLKKNKSDSDFLKICYRTYLGREADPAGFDDWMGKLAEGTSRDTIREGFIGSQEYGKICERYGIIP